MAYRLFILPDAVKAMKRIPEPDRSRIAKRIEKLTADSHPPGVVKLQGELDLHRIRAGDYRIVYRIADHDLLILVVRVGHRKDVYRKLKKLNSCLGGALPPPPPPTLPGSRARPTARRQFFGVTLVKPQLCFCG
jgi:mRNA interferase RelE/StbE